MIPLRDEELLKIGREVAKRSRIGDKEEAFSIALLGIAKGLKAYKQGKGTKLSSYLYTCATRECWVEYWRLNRKKRGKGYVTLSLDEMREQGREIEWQGNLEW